MKLEAILSDDPLARDEALGACSAAPEHERSSFAAKLAVVAREAAATFAAAVEAGEGTSAHEARFGRACIALARLRVEVARSALLRIADEGTTPIKAALAHALRETRTAEGRAVLVHLLSDDDVRADAILAIGCAPWPEVLPALIEVAEADDHAARLAAAPIARCGASGGPDELNAAADFLLELLDEDAAFDPAIDALLRLGAAIPAPATAALVPTVARAKRLTKEPGKRKAAGLCLLAAFGDEGNASFLELALSGTKTDEEAVRAFLEPLLVETDECIRTAAERTWRALDLSHVTAPSP